MATTDAWVYENTGSVARFSARRRLILSTIQLDVVLGDVESDNDLVLWALCKPRREREAGDHAFCVVNPFALCVFHLDHAERGFRTVLTAPVRRWEIQGGTKVSLLLSPSLTSPETVAKKMGTAVPFTPTLSPPPPAEQHFESCVFRLSGVATGELFVASHYSWRPLWCHRWFELKSYVREGTLVTPPPNCVDLPAPMTGNDVREAVAVSTNGDCIRWSDGSVGLTDEVKPFYRYYTPVAKERTVRVRRFPHRFADVVGEIPFGLSVEALGCQTDPFTGEVYALVCLPADSSFSYHIALYDLRATSACTWLWGWTKITGRTGVPFIKEVDKPTTMGLASTSPRGAERPQEEVYTPLDSPAFFMPTREERGVRVRKSPSLVSKTNNKIQGNEVREAVASVEVTDPKDGRHLTFVQWIDGGFSLLDNQKQSFLKKIEWRLPPLDKMKSADIDAQIDAHAAASSDIDHTPCKRSRTISPDTL